MIQTKEATTFEKYPAYKDSGVEWIGEIPTEWNILPAKRFHQVIKELNLKRQCNNILSLTLRGVVNNNPDSPEGLVPKDYATYQIFQKNDLVFKLIDLENISTSRVGLVHEKGIMSSAYIRLVIGDNCLSKFAYYFYFSLYKNEVYNKLGSGVRSTLGPNDLLNLSFLKPSFEEQIAIANFLDDKTSKIDTAIAQKEQMIELLKERKQIVIQNAVTGKWSMVNGKWGETPKEKMKDSGVEWIGEIPEGWEVKALKYIANIILGKMICNTNQGGMQLKPYLKSKNIQWLKVDVESVDEMWFSDYEMKKYRLKKDDLVLSEGGEVGKTCIWNNELGECYIQNSAHKVTIKYNSISHYYLYLFTHIGMQGGFDSIANRVSIAHLTKDKLSNVLIIQPTKEEQLQIVQYIETQSSKIDQAISLQQSQIEKLKEYKATLIDGAVTGKIRVSGKLSMINY